MAERLEPGVFLERRSYRRRRLLDGLKLLPVVAAWIFMLPLLWPEVSVEDETPKQMSAALIYVFGAWFVMILCGCSLIAALKRLTHQSDSVPDKRHEL